MSDFDNLYETLAKQVAEDAAKEGTNIADRIDALKALTPFYTFSRKHRPKDVEEGTMEALKTIVKNADKPRIVGGTDADIA